MSRKISIRLKAAFLLIIFGFNMIVGFVCAVGMDMGFNTIHHHEGEVAEVHIHEEGKKLHHEEAEHKHSHKGGKDNCCNDKVTKLSQASKILPQIDKPLSPLFFTVFKAIYYQIYVLYPSQVKVFNRYFILGHHPPIPDIRIAIQSFQI